VEERMKKKEKIPFYRIDVFYKKTTGQQLILDIKVSTDMNIPLHLLLM
jgi:hypothetical protein